MEYSIEVIISVLTILGTVVGVIKWYGKYSAKNITVRLNNDNFHNKLDMKIEELNKDFQKILEREMKNEQDIHELFKQVSYLKGKLNHGT